MPSSVLQFSENADPLYIENFTDEESAELEKVMTNPESNIFAWKIGDNLNPEQAGALLSRYSRTALTGKRLFLKEFLPNKDRGREFFESWLVDYGDDSIQEMAGGIPLSCEFVSNLAVKEIEDNRIGSYIEKSSRYVFFDKKLPDNEYMFYKDPDIMDSRYADEYVSLLHSLFESYVRNTPLMIKYIKEKNPFENQSFRIGDSTLKASELGKEAEERYGVSAADLERSYENAVKANALDFVRDYLPMATLTHVGISMNARSYDGMLNKMMASPLAEARWIAGSIHKELEKLVPSLVKRIGEKHGIEYRKFLSEKNSEIREYIRSISKNIEAKKAAPNGVALVDFTGKWDKDPNYRAQVILAGMIIYRFSDGTSVDQSIEAARSMSSEEREAIIAKYIGKRENRRHKPGRVFENIEYLFDLSGRVGIYRDIQRHRIGTQERQNFTVKLGYDTRKEYREIGIEDDYESKMKEVISLFNKLSEKLPYQAQYVVTYGFYVNWYYRMNARELFHLCELRSGFGGHPDYRKMVQEMYFRVKDVHPTVANHMRFMNLQDKQLGRLESEIRIVQKKRALSSGT